MEKETTTIQLNSKTWLELNKRKNVGETFDEVINRLLLEFPANDGYEWVDDDKLEDDGKQQKAG